MRTRIRAQLGVRARVCIRAGGHQPRVQMQLGKNMLMCMQRVDEQHRAPASAIALDLPEYFWD